MRITTATRQRYLSRLFAAQQAFEGPAQRADHALRRLYDVKLVKKSASEGCVHRVFR
jgi:hypothetical protein